MPKITKSRYLDFSPGFDIRMAPKAAKTGLLGKLAKLQAADYISEVLQLDVDQVSNCLVCPLGASDTPVCILKDIRRR